MVTDDGFYYVGNGITQRVNDDESNTDSEKVTYLTTKHVIGITERKKDYESYTDLENVRYLKTKQIPMSQVSSNDSSSSYEEPKNANYKRN